MEYNLHDYHSNSKYIEWLENTVSPSKFITELRSNTLYHNNVHFWGIGRKIGPIPCSLSGRLQGGAEKVMELTQFIHNSLAVECFFSKWEAGECVQGIRPARRQVIAGPASCEQKTSTAIRCKGWQELWRQHWRDVKASVEKRQWKKNRKQIFQDWLQSQMHAVHGVTG